MLVSESLLTKCTVRNQFWIYWDDDSVKAGLARIPLQGDFVALTGLDLNNRFHSFRLNTGFYGTTGTWVIIRKWYEKSKRLLYIVTAFKFEYVILIVL